jgi:hypothetical protein
MVRHYTAYVDEAGDDGFSRLASGEPTGQSKWLVLGTLLVSRDEDLKLPTLRNSIRAKFPLKQTPDLHFRHLKHDQCVVTCQMLAPAPVTLCMVMSNKTTLPGSKYEATFSQKGYLYNFLLRWMLERVTAHCAAIAHPEAAALKVVFSRRKGMNYRAMTDYLKLMRDGLELFPPVRSINWKVLDVDNILVEDHSKWAGLQLADCATSAFFHAVEPNAYGNYEPQYARLLKARLMRNGNRIANVGLVPVPNLVASQPDDLQRQFFLDMFKTE